ncbi:MAG TPA: VTC domain-containing protein [Vicinamibacteria bacterium]|nr:VTC domain-containing protein [Vicinamibacteria bacterium]
MTSEGTNANGYRFERKFFVRDLSKEEVESVVRLHPALFSEIFEERDVNNIYFDSVRMNNYSDNVEGSRDRKKHRIRWYGELLGRVARPTLEIKIKKGLLGRKETYSMEAMEVGPSGNELLLDRVLADRNVPETVKNEMAGLEAVLVNRYRRRYFRSADARYRITLDTEFRFYRMEGLSTPWLAPLTDEANVILELKYEPEDDETVSTITNQFPFRMTKSSKYADGIARLYGW